MILSSVLRYAVTVIFSVFAVCAFAACSWLDDDKNANIESVTTTIPGSSVQLTMNRIPAGTFTMGSPANEPGHYNDETQHSVTLTKGFYMGIYEVTQEQYEAVMGANPSYFRGIGNSPDGDEVQAKRPVEQVSWYDAIEFCNALSTLADLTPYYTIDKTTGSDANNMSADDTLKWLVTPNPSANGYRLPTEAEWEYACRAGTATAFNCGTATPGSEAGYDALAAALGWYGFDSGNANSKTHEAGKKAQNAWGLYDMHGNVWEWVWDWYGSGYYAQSPSTDPAGPASGTDRVLRGGGWTSVAQVVRSARRNEDTPTDRDIYYGFRLVRSAT